MTPQWGHSLAWKDVSPGRWRSWVQIPLAPFTLWVQIHGRPIKEHIDYCQRDWKRKSEISLTNHGKSALKIFDSCGDRKNEGPAGFGKRRLAGPAGTIWLTSIGDANCRREK